MTGEAHQLISIPDIDMASCHRVSDLEGSSFTVVPGSSCSFIIASIISTPCLPQGDPPTFRVTLEHFSNTDMAQPEAADSQSALHPRWG